MKTSSLRLSVCTAAGIALLALATGAAGTDADDPSSRLSQHSEACANIKSKDLRLAMKAQEGESAFLQYVRFHRPYEQWTTEEAIKRANAAAVTRCGTAIGLKTIDEKSFPKLLMADRVRD